MTLSDLAMHPAGVSTDPGVQDGVEEDLGEIPSEALEEVISSNVNQGPGCFLT